MRRKVAVKVAARAAARAKERQVFERECGAGGPGRRASVRGRCLPERLRGRPAVHRDAVLRPGKPGARGSVRRAPAAGRRGAHHLRARRHRAAVRAQPGHPASRRQAGEHPVRRFGDPVLADFGIATDRDAATMALRHAMTPATPRRSPPGRRRLAVQRRVVARGHAVCPAHWAPALLRPAPGRPAGEHACPHRAAAADHPPGRLRPRAPDANPRARSASPTAGPPRRDGSPRNSTRTCGCSGCRRSRSASTPWRATPYRSRRRRPARRRSGRRAGADDRPARRRIISAGSTPAATLGRIRANRVPVHAARRSGSSEPGTGRATRRRVPRSALAAGGAVLLIAVAGAGYLLAGTQHHAARPDATIRRGADCHRERRQRTRHRGSVRAGRRHRGRGERHRPPDLVAEHRPASKFREVVISPGSGQGLTTQPFANHSPQVITGPRAGPALLLRRRLRLRRSPANRPRLPTPPSPPRRASTAAPPG